MDPTPARIWTAQESATVAAELIAEVERVLLGKSSVVRRAVICLLARGHLLIEDVPGVGKTTLAAALARTIDADFRRIQFTSDLLPSDLTGISVPDQGEPSQDLEFRFMPGPLFGHLILADEINRASPKTQSALLEAMSENTVSVDGVTHGLPNPFFVVATQNPLEHHGTHPLPESQLDRFLIRLSIGYPDREHESRVLSENSGGDQLGSLKSVLSLDDLRGIQAAVENVKVEASLLAYLLNLIDATRVHDGLALGASTRGALCLRRAAQSSALIDGRDYCIPEDIRDLAVDVLAHRVLVDPRGGGRSDAEESRWIVGEIVDRVAIPL
jgi:MoxR-like ATPase